ncbi:MAG: DUF167 domain-containing protein [Nanoarchaeota archaeon]|nr:DUF167 domain-containing protein [Nanoarchaeota archaeon]
MEFPLKIRVKTGKLKTEIVKEEGGVLIVNVRGKPIDNEANKEIIKFFSKLTGKRIRIVKGLKSKNKVLNY